MKRASAIITDRGGRTSHAAIVARELGVPAIVGTMTATSAIEDGAVPTASCAEGESGRVYAGKLDFSVEEIDPTKLERPRTKIMLNVGDPEQALRLALLPSDGVGLARIPVVLRFSDFKTNEYARLLGGAPFEPQEENPMLAFGIVFGAWVPTSSDPAFERAGSVRLSKSVLIHRRR